MRRCEICEEKKRSVCDGFYTTIGKLGICADCINGIIREMNCEQSLIITNPKRY